MDIIRINGNLGDLARILVRFLDRIRMDMFGRVLVGLSTFKYVRAWYEIVPSSRCTAWGIDCPDEISIEVPAKSWQKVFGRVPEPGDIVVTDNCCDRWQLVDCRFHTSAWKYRYVLTARRYQECVTVPGERTG